MMMLPVPAVRRLNHVRLLLAPQPMLWRQQRLQLSRKSLSEHIARRPNVVVNRSAVHDKRKPLSIKQMSLISNDTFKPDADHWLTLSFFGSHINADHFPIVSHEQVPVC